MNKDEVKRILYEIGEWYDVSKEDFFGTNICIDGMRAYVEVKCKKPLSDAKKKAISSDFRKKTSMEFTIF